MMSREHHRRRSPESSRRRRKERRLSRGQLQSQPIPTSIPPLETAFSQSYQQPFQHPYQHQHPHPHPHPHQQPYQEPYNEPYLPEPSPPRQREHENHRDHARARGLSSSNSSTSVSSSTSSSLLNISQPSRRFGIGMFFSGDGRGRRRRIRKKRSKILRFGNSSSSSVGSDLAYGRGYIDRRRSREFSPPSGQRPPRADGDTDRPRPPKRAQTDEEIIELGRQFAEIAKRQNAEDLRAAGRTRPSTLTGAVTALNKIRPSNSGNLSRGTANSKPRLDSSSDDSDWESAPSDDESSEGDSDSALAYGSSHYLLSNSGRPSHFSASAQTAQTYSQDISLNRKRSLVDPKLFGPINSLRGFVRSPCGFGRVNRSALGDVRPRLEPSVAPSEPVVSAKDAPLHHVHPVATSDPSNFGVGRGSIVSGYQDSPPRSPPDSVPIQQPKPRAPVYAKVFESVDTHLEHSKSQPVAGAARPTAGLSHRGASTTSSSDAAIGTLLRAAQHAEKVKYQETHANDSKRQPNITTDESRNGSYKSIDGAALLHDAPSDKSYEQERKTPRDGKKEKGRRKTGGYVSDHGFKEENPHRNMYRDDLEHIEKVERLKNDLRDNRMLGRGAIQSEKHSDDQYIADELKGDAPARPAPGVDRPKGTIDPFQYQVADDAFPTPRYGTPTQPLVPVIKTVERVPDFSRMGSHGSYEHSSLEDLSKREFQDGQKASEATEQPTVPVGTATSTKVVVTEVAEQHHEHPPKDDTASQDHSQRESSSSQSRDPVLDDADRAYRARRLARRIKEQEERSRSNSPDRSVVDKWKEDNDLEKLPQPALLPVTDLPLSKSPYDGPDADVRIDNVLEHPKELIRFQISESRHRSSTFPVFRARDPSAERERPMLNLIRPTPAPSPAPEKQQSEDSYVAPSSAKTDAIPTTTRAQDSTFSSSSTSFSKAVSWGENETKHYVVESPEREDDPYSGTKVVIPAETTRSRIGRKNARDAVAAAAAASVGVGAATALISESVVDANAARGHIESQDAPRMSKRRSSLQFDPFDSGPPVPGPKPPGLRSSRMPGRFAEDPVFMANIAAGLEGSGFDPNIVIDDVKFHRRDSPPGSNEPFSPSAAPADRDASNPYRDSRKFRPTVTVEDDSSDSSEPTSKFNSKDRRKQYRGAKQVTSGKSVSAVDHDITLDILRPGSDDGSAVPANELSKEPKRRAKAAISETWEDSHVPWGSYSDRKEPEPTMDDWVDTSVSKKQSKKLKRPIVIQQDLHGDSQQVENVMPSKATGSADMYKGFEHLKAAERKLSGHDFDANLESTAWDPRQVVDDFTGSLPEAPIAVDKGKEKIKRARSRSATDEPLPSTLTLPSELPRENSYQIVDFEPNPASVDEFDLSKQNKKDEPLPRSLDAHQEIPKGNTGDSLSYLRSEDPPATEEEWEDLPEKPKKKKKKSKRGVTTHRGFPLRSTGRSASLPDITGEGPEKSLNDAAFAGSPPGSAPLNTAEDGEKVENRSYRGTPGEFPAGEPFSDRGRSPNTGMGRIEPRDNKESIGSSFFDLIKSSIGLGEGKEQSRTPDGAEPFLGNAGALDASAGLTGAAIHPRPRKSPERATDTAPAIDLTREPPTAERNRTPSPETEFIDPEIVEREIRPAIDPTYGDLLPLPPSRTSTPAPALDDDIPPLPESRPGTPEDDRERLLLSQKSTHIRRRSDIPLRVKTPSHSAIPIQFRLAQRTAPVSPSILKVASSPSPIAATPETGSTSKARARPMSWESTRAFKPLLLVEKTSREVFVPPTSLKEELRASSIPDETPTESFSTPSHISMPRDILQDDHPTRPIVQAAPSPQQLPPLTPVDEPESPTPRPDPVDPVSKNRSSFLLYSSPSSSQDAKDIDTSEESPTLSAAKRHTPFTQLEGNDDINELDLLPSTSVGSTTDAQVATAVIDDYADSQEAFQVPPTTKDQTTSDMIPSSESAQFGEMISTNEKGAEDVEPAEPVFNLDDKSSQDKQLTDQPREIESFVDGPGVEASVDPEVLSGSGAPESADKPAENDNGAVLAKVSKKSKKKKKRQSQKASTDDNKTIEVPVPVEDEVKPDDWNTESSVGVHAEAPVEAPVEAPANAHIEALPVAPTETAVDVTADGFIVAPADIAVKPLSEASVEGVAEVPMETSIEAAPDVAMEAPAEHSEPSEPSIRVPIEPPVQDPAYIAANFSNEASIDVPTEPSPELLTEPSLEVPTEPSLEVPAEPSAQDPADIAAEPFAEASVKGTVQAAQGSGYGNIQNKSGTRLPSIFDSMARRMFSSALGIRAPRQTEAQKAYDRAMREEERKKQEASIEEALDGVDEDLTIVPTDVSVAPLPEVSVERTVKASMEAPIQGALDVEIEAPTETPADVIVKAPVKVPTGAAHDIAFEASTEAPVETTFNIPVEGPAEASADIPAESPTLAGPEVAVEALPGTFADIPTEAVTEASVEGAIEASIEGSIKADVDVAAETPTEALADVPVESPLEAFTEVASNIAVEAPTDAPANIALEPLTEASIEGAVESPMKTPDEVFIEASSEGRADVFVDTPVEVLAEPLAPTEIGATTEQAGKAERNIEAQETIPEYQSLPSMLGGDKLGETIINERTLVEDPTSAHGETTPEQEISAAVSEVSPNHEEEAQTNFDRPTIYQKEESADTPIPEASTPPQYPPPNTNSEIVYPVQVDAPEHESGQTQSPPIDIQRPSASEEGTAGDMTLSANTELPAAAPKKNKKKKKGKVSQTRKPEPEPLLADDVKIDTEIMEESKRNEDESSSFKVSDDAELVAEGASSEHISVPSADSHLHGAVQVVEPREDATSMPTEEMSMLASETQQPIDDMEESAVTGAQATPEESGLGANENEEKPPIQAGGPDSVSIERYTVSVSEPHGTNDTDQLRQEPNMSSDREIPSRSELTDAVENPLAENAVEDMHATSTPSPGPVQPSNSVFDSIDDVQILSSDQLPSDIPTSAIKLPEESRSKKKAKKNKKKQQIPSAVSDTERAADLPKIETAEDFAAVNASLPEKTIDPSSTICDTITDSKQEAQPADETLFDAGSSSKKSDKSKKGTIESDASATGDVVESLKLEEDAALDNQDSANFKSSTAATQGEPIKDESAQESTIPAKTSEEQGKQTPQSVELNVPTEDVSESLVEPQSSATEGDPIQKETESTLPSTEAELPTEKEMSDTALDVELVSEKKQRSSAELDPSISGNLSETTDNTAMQQDTSVVTEMPEGTRASIEPAADNTDLGATQVLDGIDDPSLSNENKEEKQHSLDPEGNVDTSNIAVPGSEALSDLTEVPTISEQVNDDDRNIGSASTGTKKPKKKKKKRQSVQFAEPIAESTEILPESTSGIVAPESRSEPNELSLDKHDESSTSTELARSPSEAYPSHDKSHGEHLLQNPIESYPSKSDPSSPLPAEEEPSSTVPQTVFSEEAISCLEPVGDVISEQQNHELVETVEPNISLQPQDNIDSSASMHSQDEPDTQKLLAQTESTIAPSTTPVNADDPVLSDDQPLAEAMPVREGYISIPVEELSSVAKTSELGKSLENQEVVSNLPILAATTDEGNPLRESQETASSISPYDAEVKPSEPVSLEDQPAIEQLVLDDTIPESATVKSKKSKKKGKKGSKAQDASSKLPPDVLASSTVEGEGNSQNDTADLPRSIGKEDIPGVPETSDTLKPETDEQGVPLYAPGVTSPLILDGGDQPSPDTQVGDSAVLQPKTEIGSITGAVIDAPSTGETVVPQTIVPESAIEAPTTEERASEPTDKKQHDQLLMDQLSATGNIGSEPVSDVQTSASVLEQTTTESLVETAEDQTVLAEHVESHTQEPKSHTETEPSSAAVATQVNLDASTDVPTLSEIMSDQIPISDEATVEDVEKASAKKTKKDKKKKKKLAKLVDNEPSLPEPAAQSSSTTDSRDTTALNVSSEQPVSSEDRNAAETAPSNEIKEDKENEPANSREEGVLLTSPPEPAQIRDDSQDMNDTTVLTVPDSTLGDPQPTLVDILEAQEPANIDNTFGSDPPAQSQIDKEIQELAGPADDPVSQPHPEPEHTAADNSEQNPIALPVDVERLPAAELPKGGDTSDLPSPGPAKKTKDKKKRKKRNTSLQEEVSIDNDKTLADSSPGETQQSDLAATGPAEVPEENDTTVENVPDDVDTTRVETLLHDDGILDYNGTVHYEDVSPDASAPKEEAGPEEDIGPNAGDATRSEAVPEDDSTPRQEDTPGSHDANKVDTPLHSQTASHSQHLDEPNHNEEIQTERETEMANSLWEKGLPRDLDAPTKGTTIDLGQSAENEQQAQEPPPDDESIAAPASAPTKKSKKDKKKKKQLSPDPDQLPENNVTEGPISTVSTDPGKHAEDLAPVSTTPPPNEDDPTNFVPEKNDEEDKGKESIPLEDQIPAEQPLGDSAAIAPSDIDHPSIAEPLAPKPSNDDSPAQPPSTEKTKKKKKKKRQSAVLEDEGLQLALPNDEVVLKEDIPQEPLEEQTAQQEPVQDHSPAVELPKEMLSVAEPTDEGSPRDTAQEEDSGVAQDIPAPSETEQIIPPQETEANASSEPTTISEPGEPANGEAAKINISPVDSLPGSTPTKKRKKEKKKMKLASSGNAGAIPQEPSQLEGSGPLVAADTIDLQLPTERETTTPAISYDAKEEDVADSGSVEAGEKDEKMTKPALPEDISQTHVQAPVDHIVPNISTSSEQTEAELLLPGVTRETEATNLPSATAGETSGDKSTGTSWEAGTLSHPEQKQQSGGLGDGSAEAPQSEEPLEVASGKGSKKNKKKKSASAGALKTDPGVLTADNPDTSAGSIEAVESTQISNSSLLEENLSVPATENQSIASTESRATGRNKVANSDGHLDADAQASEPIAVQDSIKVDDAVDTGIDSTLVEAPITAALEGAAQEPVSEDQQPAPQATDDGPRDELAPEAGPGIATDNIPSSSSQEPETMQPGVAPKVDGQTDSVPSKKSKKDKKKKNKRASQVSWELEPEAEIEDLPEQQQPQQAFDEQPMTNEPADMGSSGEAVQDPFSKFASGKISKQNEQRQSQTDWEPELKSEITAGEPKPLAPSQLGQHHGMLLDHQSIAEDTQTSLKDSINLDDTLLETTSSKKSKKKNKASQLDWNVEPASPVALVPPEDPLPAEQNIIDEQFEPVDVPPAETVETVPEDEANPMNMSRAIISANEPKKNKRKGKKQSVTGIPEVQINVEQSAEINSTTGDSTPSQVGPDASEELAPPHDVHGHLYASNATHEDDFGVEEIRNLSTEEIEQPVDQTQGTEAPSQERSAEQNTNVLGTASYTEAGSLHPRQLEEPLDEVVLENQAEARTNIPIALVDGLPHEVPEISMQKSIKDKKAEEAQESNASGADSKEKPDTNLQSWDWSNIDNEIQLETLVAGAVSVAEKSSRIGTVEPSSPAQMASELEQKQLRDDDVDSSIPTLDEAKLQLDHEPSRDPELEREKEKTPITRKKSRRDKKKGKEASQSESEPVSEIQASQPQYFEANDDPQDVAVPRPRIMETEAKEPPENEWPSLEINEVKKNSIRRKASSPEEMSPKSEITPNASRKPATPEQLTLDENQQVENHARGPQNILVVSEAAEPQQTSTASSTISSNPVHVPRIPDVGRSVLPISRNRTPSPARRVPTSVDMSPAQLSSHIEHDRPFDQSTQPDKKMRRQLLEDDTMIPEPVSAMRSESFAPVFEGSDTRIADATAISAPSGPAEPKTEKSETPGHAAEDSILAFRESDASKNDDFQSFSDQKEFQESDLAQEGDIAVPDQPLMVYSDRNKEQKRQVDEHQTIDTEAIVSSGTGESTVVAGTVGACENEKGKEESKHVDKTTIKNDNVSDDPSPWERSEHRALDPDSKLSTESSDFQISPSTATEPTDEAAREFIDLAVNEQMRQFTPSQEPDASDVNAESPVMGRGEALGSPSHSDADRITPEEEEKPGTGKEQDSWDALDTSEVPEDDDTSLHVSATDASKDVVKEPFLPSLPPPRTPSALDYSRDLPPVEEETREDLEKELQSDLQGKTQIGLEANRDSGIVTDSPSRQQHNLNPGDDEGQRDSGVHMRDWADATTPSRSEERAGFKKSDIPPGTSPMDEGSSLQTPQPHERRSRRSLFDSETPKLSTPTQNRGWERGATPEKPGEDEPLKRIVTPLRSRPPYQTQRSVSDNVSDISRGATPQSESVARRSTSNTSISRLRTPESVGFRPDSPGNHSSHSIRSIHSIRSLRSAAGANTPPLRSRRVGGDLRSLSHTSHTSLSNASTPSLSVSTRDRDRDSDKDRDGSTKDPDRDRDRDTARGEASSDRHAVHTNTTPIANEGRVRAKDMPDVYDGYGEGRIGSPRSPTRPPSMRRRQSMQVMELEARVEQLLAENRALADARAHSERNLNQRNTSAITDRDAEIESLKASLKWLQNEVTRLTEVNEGLQSANGLLAIQHNEKYTRLESRHTTAARELEEYRSARDRYTQSLQAKDAEIQELRNQLEATKEQIREMKKQILATKPPDADFLRLRDEDHFDHRCQQLCSHVQQWVLRFSKFSDMRACRLTKEINDEKIIDRLDNSILDGSDVDEYLKDRVARRDIFMSMTMNMIWEFVFTRYLFGMDREQRQKLKSLEKLLTDVGPPHAVRQWRAITLTLLSKRPAFGDQRNQDTEAVVQAILQTLSMILPPPSNLEAQIQSQLRRVMREAVDLSIEMRTQRAEYMMLPPLQPEYDANGELTQTVAFKASLMDERSGDSTMSNEAYEAQGAIVRCVLFPLVVKKGDDNGVGDDEIVVSPAQVLVAKARRPTIRMVTPSSDAGGVSLSRGASPSTYAQSSVSMNMPDAPLTPEYV